MDYDLRALSVPLPEDILKLKWGGDFETALEVTERRLQQEGLPEALKQRLLLEREILGRIPRQYPYSWQEALSMLKARFQDFS